MKKKKKNLVLNIYKPYEKSGFYSFFSQNQYFSEDTSKIIPVNLDGLLHSLLNIEIEFSLY